MTTNDDATTRNEDSMTNDSTIVDRAHPLGLGDRYGPAERADLARWVVAMRRAHRAGTAQGSGRLLMRGAYCCLGLWCEVAQARGLLQRWETDSIVKWAGADEEFSERSSTRLPEAAPLAFYADPDLIAFRVRDAEQALSLTASTLNDVHRLTFDQIADVVTWSFGLTAAELVAAEVAPRVPAIEGDGEVL